MMKHNKNKKVNVVATSKMPTFSFIISLLENLIDPKSLMDSFAPLDKEKRDRVELIILRKDNNNTSDEIISDLTNIISNTKIISVSEGETVGEAFRQGVLQSINDYVICINPALLIKAIPVKGIMLDYKSSNIQSAKSVYFNNSTNSKSNNLTILPQNSAKYIASIGVNKDNYISEVLYYVKQLQIQEEAILINQDSPFKLKKDKISIKKCIGNVCAFSNWFFTVPFKELKSRNQYSSIIKEHSISRLLFISIVIISGIVMPILSYNVGNSGDEKVQYKHAKNVISYYKTFGADTLALENKKTGMHLYGASFDILTATFNDVFHIENEYAVRHVFNAIFGWLLFIFIGLIAYRIAGWRAALIALMLAFLSPRLLGHSWNNPKDIPFALGYVMSIYYIIRFIQQLPKPSFRTMTWLVVGIAISISIRIGGLLLIAYLIMFVGLHFLSTSKEYGGVFAKPNIARFKKLFVIIFFISIAGYIIGIILWPYALQNPIKNPLEALKSMTNYSAGIRQVFDGKVIWSNKVPSSYIPTYMLYTIPIIVFMGLIFLTLTLNRSIKKFKPLTVFILFFTFLFPVFYVIYKTSNLYGGMRHVLFAYPPLIIIASLGYEQVLNLLKNKYMKLGVLVVMLALAFNPAKHIIKNHPYQYIYFNEIEGGVDNALGNYEIDYYYHSMKEAAEWLLQNKILPSKADSSHKITVGVNGLGAYYFRNYTDKVKLVYIRYYDRGNKYWDYALIANSYLNPYQLKKKIWPPKNTIHTINVDDVPICAILKRNNTDDYTGFMKFKQKDYAGAIIDYEKAIKYDPANESALLNLTQVYINTNQTDKALATVGKLLKVYPNYDKALNLKGFIYMKQGKGDDALMIFNKIINKINYRFINAYYNAGIIFANKSLLDAALNEFADGILVNQNFQAIYIVTAQVLQNYKQKGDMTNAYKILAKKLHAHKYADYIFYNITENMKKNKMEAEARQLLIYVNSYNKE